MTPAAPRSASSKNASSPSSAAIPSWGFAARNRPEKLLEALRALAVFTDSVRKRYRRQQLATLIIGGLWLYVAGPLLSAERPELGSAARQLSYLTLFVVVITYNLRSLFMRRRTGGTVPGIPLGGKWALFIVAVTFFVKTSIEFNEIPNRSIADAALENFRWLPSRPLPIDDLISLSVAATLEACLLLLVANTLRLRAFGSQAPAVAVGVPVLTALLAEAPPNSRCSVAVNSVPANWTAQIAARSSGSKPVYANPIFEATIDLGSGRRFSLSAIHLRRSKGRNKHKGWKHKVKLKYSLQELESTNTQNLDNAFHSAFARYMRGFREEAPSSHRFIREIPTAQLKSHAQPGGIAVVQTLPPLVLLSSSLGEAQLPHPRTVLAVCMAMSEAWNSRRGGTSTDR